MKEREVRYCSPDKKVTPVDYLKQRNYTIGQEIGSGTFGQVFEGHCKTTGQEVAIKLIKFSSHDKSNIQRYTTRLKSILSEVQILSQLTDADENIYTTKILDFIIPETKDDKPIRWVMIVLERVG